MRGGRRGRAGVAQGVLAGQLEDGGFFGTMGTEMSCGRDWSGVTLEEFASRTGAYTGRHNTERIKRSLGGMGPLQFRRSLGLAV